MTYTIFIEYKIAPQHLQNYRQGKKQVAEKLEQYSLLSYQLLEATDQENLFVERLEMNSLEAYLLWKESRFDEDADLPWKPLFPYIIGGKEKLNIWAFQLQQS